MVSIQGISSGALGIGIIIVVLIVTIAILVGGLFLYFKWKKYQQFDVVIWERDGGEMYDKAGIFVDGKTQNKRFFLKKCNVGLNPDNVPYRKVGNKRKVYLVRYGLKNFSFLDLNKTVDSAIDEKRIEVRVGEEDVNWSINAYERQKKLFSNSLLMQLLPFILLAFVSLVILIIFIYFFKDFSVLKDVAIALRETAVAIRQGGVSGTTVLP